MTQNTYLLPKTLAFVWLPRVILVLLALSLFLPVTPAKADMGPKPGMSFSFDFKIPRVDIISGELIQCDDAACQKGLPIQQLGPQHFSCGVDSCDSMAYGYAEYNKLVITFTDHVRESNVFTKKAFNAQYTVTVTQDGMTVTEKASLQPGTNCVCCPGLALTLVLETLLASLYFSAFQIPRTMLGWVPLASLITLPFVWYIFPLLGLGDGLTTGISESFAVVVEAGFIYLMAGREISLKHVVVLSVLMNSFSFLAGLAM
jgi:hypothetical protein